MAKNLNLLDQNIVMQLVNDVERGEERGRKKQEFRDWQIYSGNVSPYVEAEIARTRPNSHAGYTISDVSFSKPVTSIIKGNQSILQTISSLSLPGFVICPSHLTIVGIRIPPSP